MFSPLLNISIFDIQITIYYCMGNAKNIASILIDDEPIV